MEEELREKGVAAEEKDPYWTRLVPVGPKELGYPKERRLEWIEEGLMTGEVFGDGSVKGRLGLKRGGLRSGNSRKTGRSQ